MKLIRIMKYVKNQSSNILMPFINKEEDINHKYLWFLIEKINK
jgi:hypothetical protein